MEHGTILLLRLLPRPDLVQEQLHAALLERLVETHGVTVFAMEANFAAAELVDQYDPRESPASGSSRSE